MQPNQANNDDLQQMQLDIAEPQNVASSAQQPLKIDTLRAESDQAAHSSQPKDWLNGPSNETSNEPSNRSATTTFLSDRTNIAIVASGFLVCFVAFIMNSDQNGQVAPERPANFSAAALVPPQAINRSFRDIQFNQSGEFLQLGLFSLLSGAETQQTRLAQIGLLPHIEKRISNGETNYAVMVGPLDQSSHDTALAKLDKNNFTYFHVRPQSTHNLGEHTRAPLNAQGS